MASRSWTTTASNTANFVDRQNPEFKALWNQIHNVPRVYTPADTRSKRPTPTHLIPLWEWTCAPNPWCSPCRRSKKSATSASSSSTPIPSISTTSVAAPLATMVAATLVAGPNWKGETPKGVKKVFRSETEFVFAVYRTQLFNPSDLDNVKKVQAGYKAQTLSAFLGTAAPKAAPIIDSSSRSRLRKRRPRRSSSTS